MLSIYLLKSVFIVVFVALPIFGILQCAMDGDQPNSSKMIWIVVMLFTGVLGALLYALFGTKCSTFRTFAATGVVAGVLMITAIALRGKPVVPVQQVNHVDTIYSSWGDTYMGEINVEQHNRVFSAVEVLDTELDQKDQSYKAAQLLKALAVMMEDRDLTLAEYETWNQQYTMRDGVSNTQVNQFVVSLQGN